MRRSTIEKLALGGAVLGTALSLAAFAQRKDAPAPALFAESLPRYIEVWKANYKASTPGYQPLTDLRVQVRTANINECAELLQENRDPQAARGAMERLLSYCRYDNILTPPHFAMSSDILLETFPHQERENHLFMVRKLVQMAKDEERTPTPQHWDGRWAVKALGVVGATTSSAEVADLSALTLGELSSSITLPMIMRTNALMMLERVIPHCSNEGLQKLSPVLEMVKLRAVQNELSSLQNHIHRRRERTL